MSAGTALKLDHPPGRIVDVTAAFMSRMLSTVHAVRLAGKRRVRWRGATLRIVVSAAAAAAASSDAIAHATRARACVRAGVCAGVCASVRARVRAAVLADMRAAVRAATCAPALSLPMPLILTAPIETSASLIRLCPPITRPL
eukprot:954631-Pleurochrysis_carterae.AAC.2